MRRANQLAKRNRLRLLAFLHFLHCREIFYSLHPRAHWVGFAYEP